MKFERAIGYEPLGENSEAARLNVSVKMLASKPATAHATDHAKVNASRQGCLHLQQIRFVPAQKSLRARPKVRPRSEKTLMLQLKKS